MWRNSIKIALEKAGFTVETAVDGIDALNRFFQFLPDVVVTDYLMPRMNAIQLTQLLRSYSSFKNVGILILTGTSDRVNGFWAHKSGANMFLKKSENLKELLSKIIKFSENESFYCDWHRDVYKIHREPFGELSDALEEKLKIEAINREILSFLENLEDEERIIKRVTALMKEFSRFNIALWLLISPTAGRIYSFPHIGNLSEELRKLLLGKMIGPLTPSEWHAKGISPKLQPVKFKDVSVFPLKSSGTEHGVVLIEGVENKGSLEYFMDYTLESMGLLAYTLNIFWEQRAASEIDFLTSLYSRRVGIAKLKELLALHKRTNIPFVVGMLDIDDFKVINDSYGHNVGDAVLREFGRIIKHSLRETDFAFRYGGEEFLLIFQASNLEEARNAIERLRKNFFDVNWKGLLGTDTPVTFSAGLAAANRDMDLYDIIEKADRALYKAKASGKNCVKIE
ncbi:hypothetical protein IX53_04870 [Kosmotoga pacifica]|uniref:Diguanylate cyclase n=2 Tax=Kosmotoga pacifica TaxID=1330330 RepID=A0A0G2ZHJ4_9BACT|nr:hypothetical protein IX53_04870 [Kosmotoga pacifica]